MSENAAPSERPLVTHFLYAYEQEATVGAAIAGVLAQTYQPLEIILSDDASSDGTFRVMREAAAAYRGPHRIVLNRNPTNLRPARHVERIMELSSGEFVIESAGDDVSAPHRAARLVEAWLASGRRAHAIHSEKRDMDDAGRLLPFAPRAGPLAGIAPIELLRRSYPLIGATMGWSRAVYDRFGPVSDLAVFQDYPIAFRALLIGEVRFLEEPLVHYRLGGQSRPAKERLGQHYFRGDRIKYMRWSLEFYRCYLRDLDRVPPPDHAECRALCELTIDRFAFTLRLVDSGYPGRIAALPAALGLARRHREQSFVRANLKYLAEPAFVRWLNHREDRALRAAGRDRPGQASPRRP